MVNKYKQQGYKVAGYISAGSWEDWRTDKSSFPASVFGASYDGWEGETWFLVSKWKELIPGMTKRMNKLKEKGFQLVEFDNTEFETGSKSDMVDYALELAKIAKSNSLLPLYKNGAELIDQDSRIKDAFSGFIVEEAFKYDETNTFASINKPTWFFEYESVDKSKVQSWLTNVWYDTSSGWEKIK